MAQFMKGKRLSVLFFNEAVKPLLHTSFPNLKYSVGLIGPGSDVLDFDTKRSIDHDWGPRVVLFLPEKEFHTQKEKISRHLSNNLPHTFRGFTTNFGLPDEKGVKVSRKITSGPINHGVKIYTMRSFFREYLGLDLRKEISTIDWLTFSEQKLLSIRKSEIFHDDLGLRKVVNELHYYPEDVWLYLLASQWSRIAQEESFMGRCGELGDELGSMIVASRLCKDIMKLCYLMEKEYSPYMKWFGTGFSKLASSKKLTPLLRKTLESKNWKLREKYLSQMYEYAGRRHNELGITRTIKPKVSNFHDRPFLVIHGELFAQELRKRIKNPELSSLPLIGSINQFSDSTDVLENDTTNFKLAYKPKQAAYRTPQ
ncbi:MAG: DUF4037 domain-containing protein [archaeon]